MRFLFLSVLLLLGCSGSKLIQTVDARCGKPCYEGNQTQAGIGVCNFGTWSCPVDGSPSICLGSGKPQEVVCNGLDNDCNGHIDEPSRPCYSGSAETKDIGSCHGGTQTCRNGDFGSCENEVTPHNEECNGLDDDCDGVIDNGIQPLLCYDGPAGSLGVGPCTPGYSSCVGGMSYCLKEVVPTAEVCDGVDNNCNGLIDDDLPMAPQDVVVIVDYSGSMEGTNYKVPPTIVAQVEKVFDDLTPKYTNSTILWSLVDAPTPYQDAVVIVEGSGLLASDFDPLVHQDLPHGSPGSNNESVLDALTGVCSADNPLSIAWRAGSEKKVLIFSDAIPQSYGDGGWASDSGSRALCEAQGIKVSVFTLPPGVKDLNLGYPNQEWGNVVGTDLGKVYSLYDGFETMDQEVLNVVNQWGCASN